MIGQDDREVRAVELPPGPRLHEALQAALDGSGPAVCPLSPGLPGPARDALLTALAPDRPTGAAVLIATSGSTGTPKIVELSAAALLASARATLDRVGAGPPWLCCLPTSHIAGIQVLVRSIVSGLEPVFEFDLDKVATAGAVHVSLVPTQLRRLLDAGADPAQYASILLGGAAAAPTLVEEARARGARLFTTYGMSETSGGCVYDGLPLDGVRAEIGADGRIRLAGPVLFDGYRLRPDLTAQVRDGDWFVTQDLGMLDDGRLHIRGRADDVINTGGEKVVAGEVQDVVARHPAVRDVVVVGRPDPEWGETVTAFVVSDEDLGLEELRDWVREHLPAYAAPRVMVKVPEIPLLPSGKPDRAKLRGQ